MQIPPSVKRKRRKNLAAYVDPLAPAPTGDKPMGNIIIIIIDIGRLYVIDVFFSFVFRTLFGFRNETISSLPAVETFHSEYFARREKYWLARLT